MSDIIEEVAPPAAPDAEAEAAAAAVGEGEAKTDEAQAPREPADENKVDEAEEAEDPDSPKARGNALFEEGKFEEAAKVYTEGLQQDPRNQVLWSNRSAARLKMGDAVGAMQDAENCARINPTWRKAHFRRGAALEALNKPFDALAAYEIAAEQEAHVRVGKKLLVKVDPRRDRVCECCLALPAGGAGGVGAEDQLVTGWSDDQVYCSENCKQKHKAQHDKERAEDWTMDDCKRHAARTQQALGQAVRSGDPAALDVCLQQFRRVQRFMAEAARNSNEAKALLAKGHGIQGAAFLQRKRGARGENQQRSVLYFEAGLAVFARHNAPGEWAKMHMSLASVFSNALFGAKPESQERAIAHLKTALSVFTREKMPEQWAIVQINLGNEYRTRIAGSKRQNQNMGIGHYMNALTVFTRETHLEQWARAQGVLGTSFSNRIDGAKATNQTKALEAFGNALGALDENNPALVDLWARTHALMGEVYQNRDDEEEKKGENQAQAISHLTTSLTRIEREKAPELWARIQRALGDVHRDLVTGDKEANHREALAHYKAAASVFGRQNFPRDWARLMHGLADLYRVKTEEDEPAESEASGEEDLSGMANEDKAVELYKLALTVRQRETMPVDHSRSASALARQLVDMNEASRALPYCNSALEAAWSVRSVDNTFEAGRRFKDGENDAIFDVSVDCCLELEEPVRALDLVEQCKVGAVRDAMGWWICEPHFVADKRIILGLRQRRAAVFPELRVADAPGNDAGWARLKTKFDELTSFINQTITPTDTAFATFLQEPLTTAEMIEMTGENRALVHWFWGASSLRAFVLGPGQTDADMFTICETAEELETLVAAIEALPTGGSLERVAELLRPEEWLAGLESDSEELVLIPHGVLWLVPMHAMAALGNRFPKGVRMVPSAQLMRQSAARPAVEAPGRRVLGSCAEGSELEGVIAALGSGATGEDADNADVVLVGDKATPELVCRGIRACNPPPTTLALLHVDGATPLVLQDVLATVRLPTVEVALLGALPRAHELATGLLIVGARSIVYPLWKSDNFVAEVTEIAQRLAEGVAPGVAVADKGAWVVVG